MRVTKMEDGVTNNNDDQCGSLVRWIEGGQCYLG